MKFTESPDSMLQNMSVSNLCILAKDYVDKYKIKGLMLEVGGCSRHPKTGAFRNPAKTGEYFGMEYHNLDFVKDNFPCTIIRDITNCPEIKDNTYNFIYTMDTFEHIAEPWKAANEMVRILKPKGLVFIVTLFAWRYHPTPIDFWRFSPHCLEFLFKDLEALSCNWDGKNRRVPMQGRKEDNDMCPTDHFGPWIENWRVFYIGRKK